MPKAVRFSKYGAPAEVAELIELPDPGEPGAGEVVLDVEVAPIDLADLYRITGEWAAASDPLPFIGGGEGMGRVIKMGADVSHLHSGDRVLLPSGVGSWQQRVRASAQRLFPLPRDVDPFQIGQLSINPLTAYVLLHHFVELKPGDWFIHNAANSNVGRYLIRLAKHMRLHSVNIVRRESAVEPLRQVGGDVVLVDGPDLSERVAVGTDSASIRLALDAVAGEATQRLAACLSEGGTVVTYGALSNQPCLVRPELLIFSNIRHSGFFLRFWLRDTSSDKIASAFGTLAELIAKGILKAEVEATYPLERIREALTHALHERNGRIILTPNQIPTYRS